MERFIHFLAAHWHLSPAAYWHLRIVSAVSVVPILATLYLIVVSYRRKRLRAEK